MNNYSRRSVLKLGAMAGMAPLLAAPALAQTDALPDTLVWSTYDLGSSGYVEASAIADAMGTAFGTRIRLQPSANAVGRIMPLKRGVADAGFLANEVYFATRGLYEFASRDWGPQDMRAVIGRPATTAFAVTKESGIKTLEDLRGKRIAYTVGNPSAIIKADAMLAGGGLTRDDVNIVEFPSFGAALRSLQEGQADAVLSGTTASVLYELESTNRGISWIELDPADSQIWEAMNKVIPIFAPYRETVGAGITGGEAVNLAAYRYPIMTVYADADPTVVRATLAAIDKVFPDFELAAAIMPQWKLELSGTAPIDAPFHEGAVRYLGERGIWTDELEAWNAAQVEQLKMLQDAWATLSSDSALGEEAFSMAWAEKRNSLLAGL